MTTSDGCSSQWNPPPRARQRSRSLSWKESAILAHALPAFAPTPNSVLRTPCLPRSPLPVPALLLPAPRSLLPMDKLTPILPCRGRDDASEPRSAAQAEELLAAWTALWHPALVAAAGAMPRWTAAAAPPDDPAGHLILLPPTAEPLLPDDWLSHAEHLGARIVRGHSRRAEMIAAALALLDARRRRPMPIWRPISWPWDTRTS